MLEPLFGSKTRLKLLTLFFNRPDRKFFVRELSRLAGVQINSVRRELARLSVSKIIVPVKGVGEDTKADEKKRYYCLNPEGAINPEMKALLIKAQIWGEKQLIEAIKSLGAVNFLLLSGRFSGVRESPTDLLVVGSLSHKELARLVKIFEREFDNEVRYTIMTLKEFLYRRDVADKFISDLLDKPHIVAVNKIPLPYAVGK